MSTAEILNSIRTMPASERRKIVGKIWGEFADTDFELTPNQAAELDRRLEEHAAHPEAVVAWTGIKTARKI